jgi:hypothetical protein
MVQIEMSKLSGDTKPIDQTFAVLMRQVNLHKPINMNIVRNRLH